MRRPGICVCTAWEDGVSRSARSAWFTCIMLERTADTREMPMPSVSIRLAIVMPVATNCPTLRLPILLMTVGGGHAFGLARITAGKFKLEGCLDCRRIVGGKSALPPNAAAALATCCSAVATAFCACCMAWLVERGFRGDAILY